MFNQAMKQTFLGVLLVSLCVDTANARIGGGKSSGMRSNSYHNSGSYNTPSRSSSNQTGYAQSGSNGANAQTPPPARNGMNMGHVAAGAIAGAGLGYLAGHAGNANAQVPQNVQDQQPGAADNMTNNYQQQPKKSGISWFWLLVLAGGAYFLYRKFMAKKADSNTYQQPNFGSSSSTDAKFSAANSGVVGTPSDLGDGTAQNVFLRFAKNTFLHVQTMNNPAQVNELQKYLTPEMFDVISADIKSGAEAADFPTLNVSYLGSNDDASQYVSSVQFSGMVSEMINAQPEPFSEIWHFSKAKAAGSEWKLAGIQQD